MERSAIESDLLALLDRAKAGVSALAAVEPPAPAESKLDLAGLFAIVRKFYGPIREDAFVKEVDCWFKGAPVPRSRELTDQDFVVAANRLGVPVWKIRAVDEVESAGGGLEPGRAEILELDGPGGFIDGDLPKILFEAHKFSKWTGGKYDKSHPDISSPKWNRSLYKGGQAEWARLWKAMQLDRHAALLSASWGRYQILGENFKLAGYPTVEAMVDAFHADEASHLEAFCSFVEKAGLVDELRRISPSKGDCVDFAAGYNGSGYAAGDYDGKLAGACRKWKASLDS